MLVIYTVDFFLNDVNLSDVLSPIYSDYDLLRNQISSRLRNSCCVNIEKYNFSTVVTAFLIGLH